MEQTKLSTLSGPLVWLSSSPSFPPRGSVTTAEVHLSPKLNAPGVESEHHQAAVHPEQTATLLSAFVYLFVNEGDQTIHAVVSENLVRILCVNKYFAKERAEQPSVQPSHDCHREKTHMHIHTNSPTHVRSSPSGFVLKMLRCPTCFSLGLCSPVISDPRAPPSLG